MSSHGASPKGSETKGSETKGSETKGSETKSSGNSALPYRVLARKYRPVDFTTLVGQAIASESQAPPESRRRAARRSLRSARPASEVNSQAGRKVEVGGRRDSRPASRSL